MSIRAIPRRAIDQILASPSFDPCVVGMHDDTGGHNSGSVAAGDRITDDTINAPAIALCRVSELWPSSAVPDPAPKAPRQALVMDHCAICARFIRPARCVWHGPADVISPKGWCKFFRHGQPGSAGSKPRSITTKERSEYIPDAEKSMGEPPWK